MPVYPNVPISAPTPGGSSGSWATQLNAALLALDNHRHQGVGQGGAKIGSDGIAVDAPLSMASNNLTAIKRLEFSAVAATGGARALFVDVDNELYWQSQSGSNVKLTSGSSPNVIVGGIGGDYVAVSAAFNYVSATNVYTAKQPGNLLYARLAAGEVRIHEHGSGSSAHVALACPAALGASYTLTFPAAVPGSTQLVQVSSAGAVSFSNTIANAVTCSGLVTASAGVTCAANQHVTVSGTGEFKHGDRVLTLSPLSAVIRAGWAVDFGGVGNSSRGYIASSGAGNFALPILLPEGCRLKSMTVARYGDGAADLQIDVLSVAPDGSLTVGTVGTATETNPGAAWADTTIDLVDTTIGSGISYWVEFAANAANLRVGPVRITYDRP